MRRTHQTRRRKKSRRKAMLFTANRRVFCSVMYRIAPGMNCFVGLKKRPTAIYYKKSISLNYSIPRKLSLLLEILIVFQHMNS